MNSIKKILSQTITSKPDTLQFAKDRKYEESWIIPSSQSRPTRENIEDYLHKETFETIIAEFIWNSQDDDKRFVLTIFLDKNCKLKDSEKFISISLGLFYDYRGFNTLIKELDKQIIGNEYLFTNPVDAVNMSIFNHWLSVGPIDLWKKNESYNKDIVKSKIMTRPEIERTTLNYQGLLFRFNTNGEYNGPYYGIKTPCCNKIRNEWIVNYDTIDYWMRMMLKFT